jgi:flagellar motor switch protein FliG
MSVLSRFKNQQDGFRALIEIWESTPVDKRKKMIEVAQAEDPAYTAEALKLLLTFQDILQLPDLELAEVLSSANPRMVATAIAPLGEDIKARFMKNAKPNVIMAIREMAEVAAPALREVGGAQLNLVTVARGLEKKGFVKTKKIPQGQPVLK